MASPEIEAIVPEELTMDQYQELAARTAGREPIVMSVMRKLVDLSKVEELLSPALQPVACKAIAEATSEEIYKQLAPHWSLMVAALGLAGEAGEFADMIKKELGHGHPVDPTKRKKELGDVQWYVADAARLSGFGLGDTAKTNIVKLDERYGLGGFSTEKSMARVDEKPLTFDSFPKDVHEEAKAAMWADWPPSPIEKAIAQETMRDVLATPPSSVLEPVSTKVVVDVLDIINGDNGTWPPESQNRDIVEAKWPQPGMWPRSNGRFLLVTGTSERYSFDTPRSNETLRQALWRFAENGWTILEVYDLVDQRSLGVPSAAAV